MFHWRKTIFLCTLCIYICIFIYFYFLSICFCGVIEFHFLQRLRILAVKEVTLRFLGKADVLVGVARRRRCGCSKNISLHCVSQVISNSRLTSMYLTSPSLFSRVSPNLSGAVQLSIVLTCACAVHGAISGVAKEAINTTTMSTYTRCVPELHQDTFVSVRNMFITAFRHYTVLSVVLGCIRNFQQEIEKGRQRLMTASGTTTPK